MKNKLEAAGHGQFVDPAPGVAIEPRVEGHVSGNVLLRRAQYRAAEQPDDILPNTMGLVGAEHRELAADERSADALMPKIKGTGNA